MKDNTQIATEILTEEGYDWEYRDYSNDNTPLGQYVDVSDTGDKSLEFVVGVMKEAGYHIRTVNWDDETVVFVDE